ncbi:cyclopropane-fatty-acyl-phospholipid synthase family protein [Stakelama saccharophila]|uniref:Cyclopropane-fatty-acyl-phospholipid synthase family protein n=1 Tax=Stakelama saccharophila TaxID=3075605 RepID=A0ABZ0BA05_9SPHN|nr:cyclopropane-fatty-acyl-phospholipid synthase family protein [Stakelama sp. W311]WNO54178.1 cyclopropane-fatty-acyl-phospholipid synthase family protein [Stakelama sp. W311]
MALIDRFFEHAVTRGELTVIYPGGRTRSFGRPDPEFAPVTLRIHDRRVFTEILSDPSLGAAEAYMAGRLTVEQGDLRDVLVLFMANNPWERNDKRLDPSLPRRAFNNVVHRLDRYNMARQAKKNIAEHYDLSDRLYDLFLDADRQYSCAYWRDPENETLEQAQDDKKAHIAAKLALEPGMKVLDIGCGWGGLALYLHEKFGVDVCGITLSEEQVKVARRRAEQAGVDAHVRFELVDYRELEGQFDRIVSVGMFEHVGPPQYKTFFRKCRNLLTPQGVMLVHTIGRSGPPGVTDHFTAKYIFPGGYIPALSEMIAANEDNRMFVTDVEVLRKHYGYTLSHWYNRTVAAKDAIVEMYDERFYRMWQYYLAGAMTSFFYGGLVNFQVQYARSRDALPLTRDYMLEAERKLHQTPDDGAHASIAVEG